MPRNLQSDWQLFGVTVALCLTGAVLVFSASAMTAREQYGNPYMSLIRQLVWLAIGCAGMLWLMNSDYRKLREPRMIFSALAVSIILLMAVLLLDRSHATHRWVRLGPASLQPSEFAKLAIILFLAWFLDRGKISRRYDVNDAVHTLIPAMAPVLLVAVLVLLGKDLGTAAMIVSVAAVMLFIAGLSWKYLMYGAIAAAPFYYLFVERVPYRYARVIGFLHPEADPRGQGFQLMQSLIAVGSGGLTGVGLMESKQKLFYLPEAHTDFIFAVLGEELGFIGAIALLVLFGWLAWRGIRTARGAPDEFGRLLALGITTLIVGQALINLSVVLGLMPTKGIPLPFVSYGGSSLLVMMLASGVLLNISQYAD